MWSKGRFIAVDLGAENGRIVVAILEDHRIKLHEVYRFNTHSIMHENSLRWDILRIYEEVLTGLGEARSSFGSEFDGIGVDTWGVDYVLLDARGNILGYPYHYRDGRTDNIMEEAFKVVPKEALYKRTGVQFAQFNTIFQLLSERKRDPNHLAKAEKMLLMPDFINYLLSGQIFSEYTIASTTGLTDPLKREWAWDLIEAFDLPNRLFSEIVEPANKLGTLLPSIARKTGLNDGIPVIATASHDTASAVVSVPARSSGNWAFLSSGTWSLMGVEVREPVLTPLAMKYNFTNEGGVEGTTRLLKNMLGLWPLQECRRAWLDKSRSYSYAYLVQLAKKEGFAKSWIDMNDPRFLKPGDMPSKILRYLDESGQVVRNDVGFIVRTVLESLAFSCRNTKQEIEQLTGKKISVVHAVGGGVLNDLLMQLTADALECTIEAGPTEGTIVGNVGVQAMAVGKVSSVSEWRDIVLNSFQPNTYEPRDGDYFNQNEKAFQRILSQRALLD